MTDFEQKKRLFSSVFQVKSQEYGFVPFLLTVFSHTQVIFCCK